MVSPSLSSGSSGLDLIATIFPWDCMFALGNLSLLRLKTRALILEATEAHKTTATTTFDYDWIRWSSLLLISLFRCRCCCWWLLVMRCHCWWCSTTARGTVNSCSIPPLSGSGCPMCARRRVYTGKHRHQVRGTLVGIASKCSIYFSTN